MNKKIFLGKFLWVIHITSDLTFNIRWIAENVFIHKINSQIKMYDSYDIEY